MENNSSNALRQFRRADTLLGWCMFAVAAIVYCMTVEPTASFWDCPEFIVTAGKLEVGHPPGAPFFMLTANFFSHFASDPSQVALMVNTMSALLSAVTIMFLFWTITHLTRHLLVKNEGEMPSLATAIAIEGAGVVGALIYTFTDTFWFSAVEGEVYAYSSAFTAVVFWLILKWEDNADKPHSDRWLVLIAYMTGLSIGVHLLNLLCIPAIVLVYCYRRYPDIELKGSLVALVVSCVIVAAVLYGVIPGIVTVGGWFELFFVNTLGLPFNTGLVVYLVALVCTVTWAIYESYTDRNLKKQNISFVLSIALLGIPFYGYGWSAAILGVIVLAVLWMVLNHKKKSGEMLITARPKNTVLLCLLMLMIGYSSYALIVIRSSANPPMDQNSPEDIFTLGNYLSRDQYGDRPLFYGQAYTSEVKFDEKGDMCVPHQVEGAPVYQRKEKKTPDERDSYEVVSHKSHYAYAQNMLFPRMYDDSKAESYESWLGGVEGHEVPYNRCGEPVMVKMPTQIENLRFFISYQCNFMYWRYFMWNFAGRQNGIQGNGELEHGNWITGIPLIDNAMLGDQSLLPDSLKNDKGHNVYYCLPLLLGVIGLFWQAWRGKKGIRQFWVVFFLFFMTGLAIVIYLNQVPGQPRERDYAYAGSFYAFAIWCGMGVAAVIDLLKRRFNIDNPVVAALIALLCLFVPIQMASQNWDDHDRSGRYTCTDYGQNYLASMQDKGNPVIFTNGDNDTFPLWYNQEMEGVRTDARVCNLSYLQTDWYIDQMRRPAYDSPSLPINWNRYEFSGAANELVYVKDMKKELAEYYREHPQEARKEFGDDPFELRNILKYWVRSTDSDYHFIPTDSLYVTIDKDAVRRSGMTLLSDSIPDKMYISLKGHRMITRSNLMMLELIASCNWTRPLYIAQTVGSSNYIDIDSHLLQEGLALRITPFDTAELGDYDAEKTYDRVMNHFKWGNVSQPGLNIDETVMRMCITHRLLMLRLSMALINKNDTKRAKEVLLKMEKELPSYNVPVTYMTGGAEIARAWVACGDKKQARKYLDMAVRDSEQFVRFYLSLSDSKFNFSSESCVRHIYYLNQMAETAMDIDTKMAEQLTRRVDNYYQVYSERVGGDISAD